MSNTLFQTWVRAIAVIIALPVHECAHAFVANRLGDPTAKNNGRITLNPFRHLDLIGTICLLFTGIGWAKPVPINPYNFKNPKAGMAISSAAGPLSNFLLAVLSMVFEKVFFYAAISANSEALSMVASVFSYMAIINISLAIFNMLPVPPFDGSRIVSYFLPQQTYFNLMRYEKYIYIAVLAVLLTGLLDRPLLFLNNALYGFIDSITGFVDLTMKAVLF